MGLAAAIVTYGRPAVLHRALEAVRTSTLGPSRLLVYDNSPDRWGEVPKAVEYMWTGRNVGLPAAIGACMDAAGTDDLLILDDDTILAPTTLENMWGELLPGVGAVTVPTELSRKLGAGMAEKRWFAWSPTLIANTALHAVGRPMGELFFGWDDWEFSYRLHKAGYRITWVHAEMEQQRAGRMWVGRRYLDARNRTYLTLRRRLPVKVVTRLLVRDLKVGLLGTGPYAGAVRRGLIDGVSGRLGPPPPQYQPSIAVARGEN